MPIPAGPGGQREAWRGPGAAAGLFWRPVTLAQIPPQPQECRSLPSPALHPTPPPRRAGAERQSEQTAAKGDAAGGGQDAAPLRASAGGQTRGPGAAGPGRASAGAARQGLGRRQPNSDSHTHSSHVDRETKTRTEPRKLEVRPRQPLARCAGGAGRSRRAGPRAQGERSPTRGADEKTEAGHREP